MRNKCVVAVTLECYDCFETTGLSLDVERIEDLPKIAAEFTATWQECAIEREGQGDPWKYDEKIAAWVCPVCAKGKR